MAKVLILSHGLLAQELRNAVFMIIGSDDSLDHLSLDVEHGVEKLREDLRAKLSETAKTGEKLLIVCDLFFGCPFITASELVTKNMPPQQCRIIGGANLPMLLELCLANKVEPDNLDHLVGIALRTGKEGIVELEIKGEIKPEGEDL
jgi:PTS system mannose-specific IIA component